MNINLEIYLELNECFADPLIRKLQIHNRADRLENAVLQIYSTSEALTPIEIPLPLLESNTVTDVPQANELQYNLRYLESLFHPLTTEMVLTVSCDGDLVYSCAKQFSMKTPRETCAAPNSNTEE